LTKPSGAAPCGVLVVDDEAALRAMLRSGLRFFGLPAYVAGSAPEALEVYRRNAGDIGVVLLDVLLPVQDGPDILRALRALRPDLPCCFMSGHTGKYTEEELLALGAARVFRKPFDLHAVAQALRQLLGTPERRREPRHAAVEGQVKVGDRQGFLRDRSPSGLGLWLTDPVEVGSVLTVEPEPPPAAAPLPVKVRHCRPEAAGWVVGCQFVASP
jgi:CheY-like chemotaxis protein